MPTPLTGGRISSQDDPRNRPRFARHVRMRWPPESARGLCSDPGHQAAYGESEYADRRSVMSDARPRSSRRVIKPADVRSAELLDAGLRVLCELGYAEATVAAITSAAGVAKGTFYLYFPTKAHLLVALRDRQRRQLSEEVMERLAEVGSGAWAAVDATLDAFVRFLVEERAVHDALYDGAAASVTVDDEVNGVIVLEELLSDGVVEGSMAVDDPLLAASMLFHGVHGAVDTALARGDTEAERLQRYARAWARRLLEP